MHRHRRPTQPSPTVAETVVATANTPDIPRQRSAHLMEILQNVKGNRDQPRLWMKDSLAKECFECQKPFSTLRRKHHCRNCGRIFCANCSSHFVDGSLIRQQGSVRVCDHCLHEITGKQGDALSGKFQPGSYQSDLTGSLGSPSSLAPVGACRPLAQQHRGSFLTNFGWRPLATGDNQSDTGHQSGSESGPVVGIGKVVPTPALPTQDHDASQAMPVPPRLTPPKRPSGMTSLGGTVDTLRRMLAGDRTPLLAQDIFGVLKARPSICDADPPPELQRAPFRHAVYSHASALDDYSAAEAPLTSANEDESDGN
ncbi:Mitochondrial distribution and morphology protein 12, partial [Dimargaris xerosporica]